MRTKRIICAFLAVAMLALSGCSGGEVKEAVDLKTVTLTSKQISEVSAKADKELTNSRFSGGAVITLNKNTIFNQSYGYTDGSKKKKNTSTKQYQISSVTKVFTGAAVAMLIDDGKLKEDDTLAKFFKQAKSGKLKSVTVGDLLSKKVDFGKYSTSFITTTDQLQKYNKLVRKNEKKADAQLKKDIVEFILNNGYGQTSELADSNYYLLGRIVEKASGVEFKKFVKERIIKKLGLKNTGFVSSKKNMTGYDLDNSIWRGTDEQPMINSYGFLYSSFGIISSPDDLCKVFTAIVNNKLTKTDIVSRAKKSNTNYNYGLSVDGRNLHAEGRTYIHSSYVFINPENYECAILLSNYTGDNDISEIGKEIHQVINSKINGILLENTDEKEFGL